MTQKEKLLRQYSDYLKMRNYSMQTYKAYMGSLSKFWDYCERKKKDADFDKSNAVQSYLAYRMGVEKRDFSTVNGDHSALQWFYKYVLNREWNVRKLVRPKKEKRLPRYITPEQVSQLLEATEYRKHQLMFLLFYSTGLRLSELRLLLWEDIQFGEGILIVRKGKGAKDRIVVLHSEMSDLLIEYRKGQHPNQQLVFEGKLPNVPIACRSVQWAFINARRKAKLPDWVTPHTLRHSYATSALKNGTDILTLRELLGHKKLATTARYLHLDTAFLKKSYNPLSDQCLNVPLKKVQAPLR